MNRCAVGAFEARRLVRTEACYIANQAELDGYRQTGIESYEFSAVLDNRTSKLCDNVDGLDGKIFKISEAVPGKNLPPMHPFCRSTTLPILPSEGELDREIAELSDEIGANVDFEEWKENLRETEDGRLVYMVKAVDKSGESGIINYARATEIFTVKNYSDDSHIDLQKVIDLLEKSDVGRTALSQLAEKGVKPIFDYSKVRFIHRGEQQGPNIKIFVRNIPNERVAAQTVIHEATHLYYGIGQNQWAEAVCFAKEKMFLTGRSLTVAERRYIVKLAKSAYPEFCWKKGGYGYGKHFTFN